MIRLTSWRAIMTARQSMHAKDSHGIRFPGVFTHVQFAGGVEAGVEVCGEIIRRTKQSASTIYFRLHWPLWAIFCTRNQTERLVIFHTVQDYSIDQCFGNAFSTHIFSESLRKHEITKYPPLSGRWYPGRTLTCCRNFTAHCV